MRQNKREAHYGRVKIHETIVLEDEKCGNWVIHKSKQNFWSDNAS